MSNIYLGITIGPIYKTMKLARKTRELWCASFSFSLLMKCLIEEFKKYGNLKSPSDKVKLPLHGAGVFPDRCYIELNSALKEKQINDSKSNALEVFRQETGYFSNELDYFQIYIVQKEITSNPMQTLNVILDGLELNSKYRPEKVLDIENHWSNSGFFQDLYNKGYASKDILPTILVKNSAGNSETFYRFMSIPEISTKELEKSDPEKYWKAQGIQYIVTATGEINFEQINQNKLDDQDEDDIVSAIKKEFKEDFKFRHKYFAIVQADGDNVASLIKELEKNNGDIMELSNALNDFVKDASEELVKYGAFPIYMGGDDLLFFAPLTNEKYEADKISFKEHFPTENVNNNDYQVSGTNIFYLMTRLNILFKDKLASVVKKYMKDKSVSLSFGISVGYYKKPMNEILAESYELLFYNAKKQPCKNYIALKLEKHSGQSFEFGFTQNTRLYYHFLSLCNESEKKGENFLNSVMFKIKDQKKIIIQIAQDLDKLKCFFTENFNEAKHKDYQEFFEAVRNIIYETFEWFKHETNDRKISRIYNCLRFVQFLNAKDSHE